MTQNHVAEVGTLKTFVSDPLNASKCCWLYCNHSFAWQRAIEDMSETLSHLKLI